MTIFKFRVVNTSSQKYYISNILFAVPGSKANENEVVNARENSADKKKPLVSEA
jgi:hypothetical protein